MNDKERCELNEYVYSQFCRTSWYTDCIKDIRNELLAILDFSHHWLEILSWNEYKVIRDNFDLIVYILEIEDSEEMEFEERVDRSPDKDEVNKLLKEMWLKDGDPICPECYTLETCIDCGENKGENMFLCGRCGEVVCTDCMKYVDGEGYCLYCYKKEVESKNK